MERIIEVSSNYNEGMLTAREYLGLMMTEIGNAWEATPETETETKFASDIAALIIEGSIVRQTYDPPLTNYRT